MRFPHNTVDKFIEPVRYIHDEFEDPVEMSGYTYAAEKTILTLNETSTRRWH